MNKVYNIIIVGVGGQGILLASEILAQAAALSNLDVKVAETHGMAQRGGSVVTHVRLGKRVYSPLVEDGHADYLLAFELLEAARHMNVVKPGGKLIVSTQKLPPITVTSGGQAYPSNLYELLSRRGGDFVPIEAGEISTRLGNPRVANLVMLGALSAYLDIPGEAWQQSITGSIPTGLLDINQKAFQAGYEASLAWGRRK